MSTRGGFPQPSPREKEWGEPSGQFPWERDPHPREKTVEATFHACVQKKEAVSK